MLEWAITHHGKPVGTIFAEDHGAANELAERYCVAQAIRFTRTGLHVALVNCRGDDCGACKACLVTAACERRWGVS